MHVEFAATLAKIATKRARRDKDGMIVEEPAVSVTLDVPVSVLTPAALGALLRAVEQELGITLDDGQAAFDVVGDRLEVTAGARR